MRWIKAISVVFVVLLLFLPDLVSGWTDGGHFHLSGVAHHHPDNAGAGQVEGPAHFHSLDKILQPDLFNWILPDSEKILLAQPVNATYLVFTTSVWQPPQPFITFPAPSCFE